MGLKGIHAPEALQQHSGLTFCPWCGKEGQNEGTVVNHLQTMHYHLGLICTHCLDYSMTSTDAMHWHTQLCRSMAAGNDDDREESPPEYEENENGDGNYILYISVHARASLSCESSLTIQAVA